MSAGSGASPVSPRSVPALRSGAAVSAAPPGRLRALWGTLVWTTPVQLWCLMGAVAVSAMLLFGAVTVGISDSRQAFKMVGQESVPSIYDAQDLCFALSDMDADAANYLLVSEYPSAKLARAQVVSQYEQRRQSASDLLVSAARSITYGDRERRPILAMTVGIQRFDALVAQAELLSDRGDRAGALDAHRQATGLMHDPRNGLLRASMDLADANHDALTTGYDEAQTDQGRDVGLIEGAGLLLLASLIGLQLFLACRMRRALNLPALTATALSVLLLLGALGTLGDDQTQLGIARLSFSYVYSLRQLRAVAFDANADESRYLVDPRRAQAYQQAFLTKSLELASFGRPVTLATYDAALAQTQSAIHYGRPFRMGGLFWSALKDQTDVGVPDSTWEIDEGTATLVAFARYERDDRVLRADVAGGNLAEAARYDLSPAPNDSDGDFNAFDTELGRWIRADQVEFDGALADGRNNLNGWQLYPALGALLVASLTFLGLRPRLGEYV